MMHTVNDAVHKARNTVSIELWAPYFCILPSRGALSLVVVGWYNRHFRRQVTCTSFRYFVGLIYGNYCRLLLEEQVYYANKWYYVIYKTKDIMINTIEHIFELFYYIIIVLWKESENEHFSISIGSGIGDNWKAVWIHGGANICLVYELMI